MQLRRARVVSLAKGNCDALYIGPANLICLIEARQARRNGAFSTFRALQGCMQTPRRSRNRSDTLEAPSPRMSAPAKTVSVRQFFSRNGLLSRCHPQYEFRPGQLDMAEAVEAAIR